MSTQTLLEVIGLLAGGGGAGAVISKLTRLVVAVEGLVDSLKTVTAIVGQHETRISQLEGQQQAKAPGSPAG